MSGTPSVLELLQTCDLAKQWPNLKGVHDIAMKQLMKATQDAEKQLADEKAADDAAAQRALNERYVKDKARIEAEAKAQEKPAFKPEYKPTIVEREPLPGEESVPFNSETIQRRTDI